uniref:Uncharacterized protein n=1 Tax=Ditylenchus dipsaci TaxID=166011 RepID=A0A915D113_9BILA
MAWSPDLVAFMVLLFFCIIGSVIGHHLFTSNKNYGRMGGKSDQEQSPKEFPTSISQPKACFQLAGMVFSLSKQTNRDSTSNYSQNFPKVVWHCLRQVIKKLEPKCQIFFEYLDSILDEFVTAFKNSEE